LFFKSIRKDVITMVCTSIKPGVECPFMTRNGCQYNGGACHQIVEQCEGCQKVREFPSGKYCIGFPDPAVKWRNGVCNMATHIKGTNGKALTDKINPLKASKRRV
jgi:hypothetical protein